MTQVRLVSLTALIAACGWSVAAQAQTVAADPAPTVIDEIIVTAQKRDERLSEVPMSVVAFSGAQLESLGVVSVADLVKVTPGLTVSTTYSDTPVYTIRGVGFYENSLAVTPAVSVYVDQVPLPYSVMTEGAPFDVQRVEVLKGPQGSLFGRNATGGAINYVPNAPGDVFGAGARVGYGNFNAVHAEGFVSGPLSDKVSARLSGTLDRRDAWQESRSRPGDKNGAQDFTAARLLVNFEPTDTLKLALNINGWVNKSDTQAWQFQAVQPTAPGGYAPALAYLNNYAATYGPTPRNAKLADWDAGLDLARDDRFYQLALRADWDLGKVQVTSISSYANYKRNGTSDGDGTPQVNILSNQKGDIESYFQELRASGDFSQGRGRWMIGGNYSNDTSHEVQRADNQGSNAITPFGFFYGLGQLNDQKIESKGVFASVGYDLTETLTWQTSARYTTSDDDFSGCVYDTNGTLAAVFSGISSALTGTSVIIPPGKCTTLLVNNLPAIDPIKRTLSEDNVSWRTSLDWKPVTGTLLYVNAARGYKSGSFAALPAASVTQLAPVPQESILAFEAGFKHRIVQGLDVEFAAFHYGYSDKQLRGTTDVPPLFSAIPALVSVPKSEVKGLEGTLNWRPIAGLWMNLGATYVDSEVTSSYLSKDPAGVSIDIKGDPFPYTPKWQWTANARYEFQIAGDLNASIAGSLRHQGKSRSGFGTNPVFEIPEYTVLDLTAAITSANDRWRLEFWGRNVADKYYVNNVVRALDTRATLAGMPATYGITLGVKY